MADSAATNEDENVTAPAAPMAETPVAVPTTEVPAAAPVQAAPVVSTPKGKKPKWIFGAVAAALVLVIAGGAYGYLGIYTQTPENLWKSSLENTRRGINAFVDKGPSTKKGLKVSGNFKMTLPVAADGSVSGSVYDKSSAIKLDAGASGVRASLEMRTLPVSGTNNPDLYLNVTGIKSLAALAGADSQLAATIDSLDGKWLVADHTLIDQLEQSAGSTSATSITNETPEQINKDLQDIEKKATVVLNDRLFSSDQAKAVLVIKDKLQKEDFQGRKSQHLVVKVQKTQLHDFAVALKDALKSSKLNDWLVGTDKSQTFEKVTDFDSLLKSIDTANYDKATADVWVDTATKTIRNVRLYNSPSDTKSYTDITFDYTGGDEYPFIFHFVNPSANDSTDVTLRETINNKTDNVKLSLSATGKDSRGTKTLDVAATLELTPTDEKLTVEKPANATNIVNLLGGLMGQIQDVQNQLKVINPTNSSLLDSSTSNLQ